MRIIMMNIKIKIPNDEYDGSDDDDGATDGR